MTGPLLAVPAFGGGRGGGHLARSAALVRELRALGREAYIFIPGGKGPGAQAESPAGGFPALLVDTDPAWILASEEELARRSWEWIILDRFQTAPEEFRRWAALAPVIGIDEGGPAREAFDFLIDLLPGLPGVHPANITAPYLLPLHRGPVSVGGLSPSGVCPRRELTPTEGSVPPDPPDFDRGLSPQEGSVPAGGVCPLGSARPLAPPHTIAIHQRCGVSG